MTAADRFKSWVGAMDPKAYSGFLTAALLVVAFTVFGVLPAQGLLAVNALLSGVIWSACLGIMVIGGARVDRVYYAAACMIAGGLTLTTPSLFTDHSPVDWGSTISRAGFCLFVLRACVDIHERWKVSKGE